MTQKGVTASDVAREVWGSATDRRGYSVGRNRDRIGHYLAGTSYPEPENLERLAKALDVAVVDLMIERPAGNPTPRARPAPSSHSITEVVGRPGALRLQLDKQIADDWEAVAKIMQLIQELERKLLGTVITGNGNGNGNGGDTEPTVAAANTK
jgi:hypothetical protein